MQTPSRTLRPWYERMQRVLCFFFSFLTQDPSYMPGRYKILSWFKYWDMNQLKIWGLLSFFVILATDFMSLLLAPRCRDRWCGVNGFNDIRPTWSRSIADMHNCDISSIAKCWVAPGHDEYLQLHIQWSGINSSWFEESREHARAFWDVNAGGV